MNMTGAGSMSKALLQLLCSQCAHVPEGCMAPQLGHCHTLLPALCLQR